MTLKQILVNVSKNESSYVYFTLESNEGLCFYSTLTHEKAARLARESSEVFSENSCFILIHCDQSTFDEVNNLLNDLTARTDMTIIYSKEIADSKESAQEIIETL